MDISAVPYSARVIKIRQTGIRKKVSKYVEISLDKGMYTYVNFSKFNTGVMDEEFESWTRNLNSF